MKLKKTGNKTKTLANYVNTGGFNRLAGRPSAPGSWQPVHRSRWWKNILLICGMSFILTGMYFVIF